METYLNQLIEKFIPLKSEQTAERCVTVEGIKYRPI